MPYLKNYFIYFHEYYDKIFRFFVNMIRCEWRFDLIVDAWV